MADEVKRIRAVFEADVSKYNSSLDGVNKQMKLARAETRLAQKELEGFGTSSSTVAKVQEKMNQQIELNRKKIELFSQSLSKSQQTIDTNVKAREQLNQKITEAKEALAKAEKAHGKESEAVKEAKEALEAAEKAYDKNESAIKSNIQRVAEYESQIMNAKSEIQGLENQISSQNKKMQEQNNHLKTAAERLDQFGDKAKSAGEAISHASDKVLGVSASMATLIGASSVMSMSFEKNLANINTLLDDTKNLDKYKNKILELSDETGIAIGTVSDGMYQAISSLGDLGDETTKIFETMTKSAKAGGAEVSDAVSLISAGMKGYGQVNDETAKKISDLAFQTAKLGVTTFPEMASSMKALFPLSSTLNMSLEELFGSMATLTGVTGNTAEVSTQLKAVFSNLIKPTTAMQKLIEKYGYSNSQAMLEAKGFVGVLEILQKETGGSSDKMGELFSSTEALTAVLALTGEQYDNFISKSAQMENAAGATNTALNKIESTKSDELQRSLNELKNSFIDLGEAAIPMIDKFIGIVNKVTDVIKDMDEETLNSIVNMTAMGIAVGVSGKAIGGTVSTVGTLSKGLSTAIGWASKFGGTAAAAGTAASTAAGATGMGAMVSSLGAMAVAAGPWLLAGAAVVGTGVAIHHQMSQEVIPTVDLFADTLVASGTAMTQYGEITTYTTQTICEETQKQVQAYLDMDVATRETLMNLYVDSTTLTSEMATTITQTYSEMGTMIKEELQKDKEDELAILTEAFRNHSGIRAAEQVDILEKTRTYYEDKAKMIETNETAITAIYEQAANEKRALTETEVNTITALQNQMRDDAVTALSEQAAEAEVILSRMKDKDIEITAEMASEKIKSLNEQRDAVIEAAETERDEKVKAYIDMRDKTGAISDEQYEKLVESANKQCDETIAAAQKTRDESVDKIFEMNEELITNVDTTTGDIITKWQQLFGTWDKWEPKKKTTVIENKTINTVMTRRVSESGNKSTYKALNDAMYNQLQRSMMSQLETLARFRGSQRHNYANQNINLTPQFEGQVSIILDDNYIIKKNVTFIDRTLAKRNKQMSFGGLQSG